ncbi:hypothetical protein Q8A73_003032 [Channa argus]|nr:hypothetical protein Q8A73_003032 [Channa argus]
MSVRRHIHREQLTAPHVNRLSEYDLVGIAILEMTNVTLQLRFRATERKLRSQEDVRYVTNTAYVRTGARPAKTAHAPLADAHTDSARNTSPMQSVVSARRPSSPQIQNKQSRLTLMTSDARRQAEGLSDEMSPSDSTPPPGHITQ